MTNIQAINLLKGLEQSLDDYCELNDEGKTAFRMAIAALELFGNAEQLPSAQTERRWIPCSERLPEYDGEKYLVTVYCESINRARIHLSTCYINREGFWGDVPLGYTVVAWMPLPRAYEGGQRE